MIILNNQLTRSGVAYNLEISPHRHIINYEDEELEFVFSSDRYKQIFLRKLEDNRLKINESLSNRFGFTFTNNKLCDLRLYSMTEKRGFLIKGKEDFRCLDTIELTGVILTQRN